LIFVLINRFKNHQAKKRVEVRIGILCKFIEPDSIFFIIMALEMMSNPLIGNQEFMQKQQEIMMEQIKEMQQIASMQVIEQFPDVLQNYSDEETKMLFETMISRNQIDLLANKKGPLGGFTALHWMCIKNDLEMIEFLIKRCKADVNSRAQLGETPILICIK
jgi:hypothetical protein